MGLKVFLTFFFLYMFTAASEAVPSNTETAIDFLKTACASGEVVEIKAEGDGGLSFLKKGVQGSLYFSKKDLRGIVEGLKGELQRDNIHEQRECMRPHIDRVLDSLLPPKAISGVGFNHKNDSDFWNNGRPLWKDLERNAGTGSSSKVISWEDGCYLCEAENNASLTKCYATVAEAKTSGWSNGFSGFHPQLKAWCSPSQRPIGGVRMDLNTRNNAIMLR